METNINQRWRDRRGSYRPAGELIDTSKYEVAVIAGDKVARDFVTQHHYSGTYPSARARFGIYQGAALVGVAVFSHPTNNAVFKPLPGEPMDSIELGRFVLLDDVPGNAETWFLGRCFEHLRADGLTGVVSFSDPLPRQSPDGVVTHGGHVGTIYQAHNATYLGRGTKRTLSMFPDGSVFSDRAASKVRAGERGWRYAVDMLVAHGATPLLDGEDRAAWLARVLPTVTRKVRHPGNHKYVWGLDRGTKKHLGKWVETTFGGNAPKYPKMIDPLPVYSRA